MAGGDDPPVVQTLRRLGVDPNAPLMDERHIRMVPDLTTPEELAERERRASEQITKQAAAERQRREQRRRRNFGRGGMA